MARVAYGMTRVRTDPDGAGSDFAQVLRRDPRHAVAHYGMAWVIRSKDPQEALRHLDRALDTDPHLIDALQLRALVRGRLGDRATLDDVDRLIESPTTHRLYNSRVRFDSRRHATRRASCLENVSELTGRLQKRKYEACARERLSHDYLQRRDV